MSPDGHLCPVESINLRGGLGGTDEKLGPSSLMRLAPGRPLFLSEGAAGGASTSLCGPLHAAFPSDCWYLPGRMAHRGNDLDDYATVTFSSQGPTRVYVLLPSFMSNPRCGYRKVAHGPVRVCLRR